MQVTRRIRQSMNVWNSCYSESRNNEVTKSFYSELFYSKIISEKLMLATEADDSSILGKS